MKTIGILLPRSFYYTTINLDILEGMREGIKALTYEGLNFKIENIGHGTDKQVCYKAAENLLLNENADIVVAYIGHRNAQLLRPLFTGLNKLLIVLDAGAHLPHEWPVSSNIVYLSLHNALGANLSAKMAAEDGYAEAGLVSGFYDSGYLHTYAFSKKWQDLSKQIVFNHITGYKQDDFSMEPLKAATAMYPNACLFSLFSGDYVQWFLKGMRELFEKLPPIYATPFFFEEKVLSESPYPGDGIRGVAAWASSLENTSNLIFKEKMSGSRSNANIFSLLGWECSIVIDFLLKTSDSACLFGDDAVRSLSAFSANTPRGEMKFNSEINYFMCPLYKAVLNSDRKGNCKPLLFEQIEKDAYCTFEEIVSSKLDNAVSGWYNSYTCI